MKPFKPFQPVLFMGFFFLCWVDTDSCLGSERVLLPNYWMLARNQGAKRGHMTLESVVEASGLARRLMDKEMK